MKYLVLALTLLAAGLILGHVERESELYTPVVRIRSTDGLYMTMVQPRTARQNACAAVVQHFEQALKLNCEMCTVESASCATSLQGVEGALARGERLPIYTISAEGIRVGLLGPPRSVETECQAMASQFVRSGIRSAACIAPLPNEARAKDRGKGRTG
jgi:hypothetical protein